MTTVPRSIAKPAPRFLTRQDFEAARKRIQANIHHTPLVSSRLLSERTGFEVRLKAEMFQRVQTGE